MIYQLDFTGAQFDEDKRLATHHMTPVMHAPTWRLSFFLVLTWLLTGFVSAEALKRVEQTDFGKTQDGSVVKLITLRNAKGMSAQIITYGAIIKELQCARSERGVHERRADDR